MKFAPETRLSLLHRLVDRTDDDAWSQFVEIYGPAIYRLARTKGLQHADAEDTTQQVLISVANALSKRPHDPEVAKFRTWLHHVTSNAAINALTRRRHGDVGLADLSGNLESPHEVNEHDSKMLQLEVRRQVFAWAAKQIESEFQHDTWLCFWRTAVDNLPCEAVAQELGKKIGAVYTARSRVMRRLQEKVAEFSVETI